MAVLQAGSQCWDTIGMPLPMAQRNLAVRRILSVTRTVHSPVFDVSLPPAANVIKLFTAVIYEFSYYARVFVRLYWIYEFSY